MPSCAPLAQDFRLRHFGQRLDRAAGVLPVSCCPGIRTSWRAGVHLGQGGAVQIHPAEHLIGHDDLAVEDDGGGGVGGKAGDGQGVGGEVAVDGEGDSGGREVEAEAVEVPGGQDKEAVLCESMPYPVNSCTEKGTVSREFTASLVPV